MHPDHREYMGFASRSRLEKSVNSLLGIIEGILIDGEINPSEISFLNMWLDDVNGNRKLTHLTGSLEIEN